MSVDHITVCICTFKRPALLRRLLDALGRQTTNNLFSYSIVVADNDSEQSAHSIVQEFSWTAPIPVAYCVEPRQNIALVRNKAVSKTDGEYIAFIDDDETAPEDWLFRLHDACRRFGCDGVLGPVLPYFDADPPAWVIKGKFFERPEHVTGHHLSWPECRTGNVLFRRDILNLVDQPFRPQFETAGEDTDFFRRMIDNGFVFRWCSQASVYELVPAWRCSRRFLIRRALLRGSNFPKHPANRLKNLIKSLAAVPAYILALPVLATLGQHLFWKYLIKLLEHTARLLAFSGVLLVKERET